MLVCAFTVNSMTFVLHTEQTHVATCASLLPPPPPPHTHAHYTLTTPTPVMATETQLWQ